LQVADFYPHGHEAEEHPLGKRRQSLGQDSGVKGTEGACGGDVPLAHPATAVSTCWRWQGRKTARSDAPLSSIADSSLRNKGRRLRCKGLGTWRLEGPGSLSITAVISAADRSQQH